MKFKKYLKEEKNFDIRNIENETVENDNFRKVLFTGKNLQLVLMSLNPGEDVGEEIHNDTDQFFRIDEGQGEAHINGEVFTIKDGSSIVIIQGAKHNIINTSKDKKLKFYSIYAPPHHPNDTIHKTKEEALKSE